MTLIQTACLFFTGYLVSRLILRAEMHDAFAEWLVRRSHGRAARVMLGVMLLAFGLSAVVPNALTVLALLPLVSRLKGLWTDAETARRYTTLLAMGLIYGANLGGVGSLLGSPANLYLLVNLRIYDVPGRDALNFVSWLAFGLPMALGLLGLIWGMIHLTEKRIVSGNLQMAKLDKVPRSPRFRPAVRWSLVWAVCWVTILVAALITGRPEQPGAPTADVLWSATLWGKRFDVGWLDVGALAFMLVYSTLVMLWPVRTTDGRERLLRLPDLVKELPIKGILVAAVVLGLLIGLASSGAVGWLKRTVPHLLPQVDSPFLVSLALVLITIFTTELLNNTTVSTVMFPVAAVSSGAFGADPLLVMLGVSLASTCAFMTPVATPVNALALASIGGLSLRRFLLNGLLTNLVAAVWIAAWLTWVIPLVLNLF